MSKLLSVKKLVETYNEVSLTEFLEIAKYQLVKDGAGYQHIEYMEEQNKDENYPESDRYSDDIINMFDYLGVSEDTFLKYSK